MYHAAMGYMQGQNTEQVIQRIKDVLWETQKAQVCFLKEFDSFLVVLLINYAHYLVFAAFLVVLCRNLRPLVGILDPSPTSQLSICTRSSSTQRRARDISRVDGAPFGVVST